MPPIPLFPSGNGETTTSGRFLYDENSRELLLRTTIGGMPTWTAYCFGGEGGATAARVRNVATFLPGLELSSAGAMGQVVIASEALVRRSKVTPGRDASGEAVVRGPSAEEQEDPHGRVHSGWVPVARGSAFTGNDQLSPAAEAGDDIDDGASDGSVGARTHFTASTTVVSRRGPRDSPGTAARLGLNSPRRPRSGTRRPRTSALDFSGFAASLAAAAAGVYHQTVRRGFVGPRDVGDLFHINAVVSASTVLPLAARRSPMGGATRGRRGAARGGLGGRARRWRREAGRARPRRGLCGAGPGVDAAGAGCGAARGAAAPAGIGAGGRGVAPLARWHGNGVQFSCVRPRCVAGAQCPQTAAGWAGTPAHRVGGAARDQPHG
eukprot:TRINITY_DN6597_c0_g1_i1.p1 TRINITY_DN6597_c0_g1~~TRINITY_DN6597_c0_g1_i1.p1  ORF type:complete len:380 (-),score=66.23 TRINITY_DN6597_c0_g1_i1:27-1166(-)